MLPYSFTVPLQLQRASERAGAVDAVGLVALAMTTAERWRWACYASSAQCFAWMPSASKPLVGACSGSPARTGGGEVSCLRLCTVRRPCRHSAVCCTRYKGLLQPGSVSVRADMRVLTVLSLQESKWQVCAEPCSASGGPATLSSMPRWAVRQPELCGCHHTACRPKLLSRASVLALVQLCTPAFGGITRAATRVVARGPQVARLWVQRPCGCEQLAHHLGGRRSTAAAAASSNADRGARVARGLLGRSCMLMRAWSGGLDHGRHCCDVWQPGGARESRVDNYAQVPALL
jgi:hypothetical protein